MEIMYNACYGGFSLSNLAVEMFLQNCGYVYCKFYLSKRIERDNVHMIHIVKQLGSKANGKYADIKIACIPPKYRHHYGVSEYDGYESICIDTNAYKVDSVRNILNNDACDDKLAHICQIIDEDEISHIDENGAV